MDVILRRKMKLQHAEYIFKLIKMKCTGNTAELLNIQNTFARDKIRYESTYAHTISKSITMLNFYFLIYVYNLIEKKHHVNVFTKRKECITK